MTFQLEIASDQDGVTLAMGDARSAVDAATTSGATLLAVGSDTDGETGVRLFSVDA